MAKHIKVLKCPQCGSTKPQQIRPDHYRCDKCGTEFILDNDDININVNHNHSRNEGGNIHPTKGVWIGLGAVFVVGIIFLVRVCTNIIWYTADKVITYQTYETTKTERSKYLFSRLLSGNDQGVVFYLENRGTNDSTYAVFHNLMKDEIVNEHTIGLKVGRNKEITSRFFVSDNTEYLIINNNQLYKIDPDKYTLTDVTKAICSRKPALEAGLMNIEFVAEGTGDGFRMNTNLGKELFYFPATDVLCTEKAFDFMRTDNTKGVLPGAKNQIYYLFFNKESSHSSNVAQLMEITYLFNNGGPENKLQEIPGGGIRHPEQHRIISSKAITEERVCFSPTILYCDDRNILISSSPTVVRDAVVNVQLLDTSGNILWTTAFTSDFRCTKVVRTGNGFLLQISENNFWEISNDGENAKNYNF